mgnify:CR=1 FL=1
MLYQKKKNVIINDVQSPSLSLLSSSSTFEWRKGEEKIDFDKKKQQKKAIARKGYDAMVFYGDLNAVKKLSLSLSLCCFIR